MIVRPVTQDGMVGYDSYGQLCLKYIEDTHTVHILISDVRTKICAICNHGWEPNAVSLRDQRHWSLIEECVHESCLQRHVGLCERAEFTNAIILAKLRFHGLRPIQNGYWISPGAKPWYEAELLDYPARIVLGVRKHVTHVEIIAEGGTAFEWWCKADDMFAAEDVTKDFSPIRVMLHAWSSEKVREYVKRFAELLKGDSK